eukprot:COSAG04_NODE_17875_length_457_cov_0.600559_1_plen_114_part_10
MALGLGLPKIKDEPTYACVDNVPDLLAGVRVGAPGGTAETWTQKRRYGQESEDVSKTAKRRCADSLPPSALVRRRKSSRKQSSPFIGVSWFKRERKWKAHITDTNGKQTQLGYF